MNYDEFLKWSGKKKKEDYFDYKTRIDGGARAEKFAQDREAEAINLRRSERLYQSKALAEIKAQDDLRAKIKDTSLPEDEWNKANELYTSNRQATLDRMKSQDEDLKERIAVAKANINKKNLQKTDPMYDYYEYEKERLGNISPSSGIDYKANPLKREKPIKSSTINTAPVTVNNKPNNNTSIQTPIKPNNNFTSNSPLGMENTGDYSGITFGNKPKYNSITDERELGNTGDSSGLSTLSKQQPLGTDYFKKEEKILNPRYISNKSLGRQAGETGLALLGGVPKAVNNTLDGATRLIDGGDRLYDPLYNLADKLPNGLKQVANGLVDVINPFGMVNHTFNAIDQLGNYMKTGEFVDWDKIDEERRNDMQGFFDTQRKDIESAFNPYNPNDSDTFRMVKGVASTLPEVGSYAVNPLLGMSSTTGNQSAIARDMGMSEDEALLYGLGQAGINKLSYGKMLSKGNTLGSTVRNIGTGATMDSLASNTFDVAADKLRSDDGQKIGATSVKDFENRVLRDGLTQAVVGTGLHGIGTGYNAYKNARINSKANKLINNPDMGEMNKFSKRNVDESKNTQVIDESQLPKPEINIKPINPPEPPKPPMKPIEEAPIKPIEEIPVKTVEEAPIKPIEEAPIKPIEEVYSETVKTKLQSLDTQYNMHLENMNKHFKGDTESIEYKAKLEELNGQYETKKAEIIAKNKSSIDNALDKIKSISESNKKTAENKITSENPMLKKKEEVISKNNIEVSKEADTQAIESPKTNTASQKVLELETLRNDVANMTNTEIRKVEDRYKKGEVSETEYKKSVDKLKADELQYQSQISNELAKYNSANKTPKIKNPKGFAKMRNRNKEENYFPDFKLDDTLTTKSYNKKLDPDEEDYFKDFKLDDTSPITKEKIEELGLEYTRDTKSNWYNTRMDKLAKQIADLDNEIIKLESENKSASAKIREKKELLKSFNRQKYKFDNNVVSARKSDYPYEKTDIENLNVAMNRMKSILREIDKVRESDKGKAFNERTWGLEEKYGETWEEFRDTRDYINGTRKEPTNTYWEASKDEDGIVRNLVFKTTEEIGGDKRKGMWEQIKDGKEVLVYHWKKAYEKIASSNRATEQYAPTTGRLKNSLSSVNRPVERQFQHFGDYIKDLPLYSKAEKNDFYHYITHRRNISTTLEGKDVANNSGIERSLDQVKKLESKYPKFKGLAEKYDNNLANQLEKLLVIESKYYSKEQWKEIREKSKGNIYATLERIVPEAKELYEPFGQLKGNFKGDYLDIMEGVAKTIYRSTIVSETNKVGLQFLKEVRQGGKISEVARIIKASDRAKPNEQILKVRENGEIVQVAINNERLFREMDDMFSIKHKMKLGEKAPKSVKATYKYVGNKLGKGSSFISRGLTQYNIFWGGFNFLRDLPKYATFHHNPSHIRALSNYVEALMKIGTDTVFRGINGMTGWAKGNISGKIPETNFRVKSVKNWEDMSGRDGSKIWTMDTAGKPTDVMERIYDINNPNSTIKGNLSRLGNYMVKHPIKTSAKTLTSPVMIPAKAYGKFTTGFNSWSEDTPRFAEYLNITRNGGSKLDGVLGGKEITNDYGRRGDWSATINKGYPLFGSTVQAVDNTIRQFKDSLITPPNVKKLKNNPPDGNSPDGTPPNGKVTWNEKRRARVIKNMVITSGLPVALSVASLIFAEDEEDREEVKNSIDREIRNNNFIIYTGNGGYIKIPKTDVNILSNAIEGIMNVANGGNTKEELLNFAKITGKNSAPPLNPTNSPYISPVWDKMVNKKWNGDKMTPNYMEDWTKQNQWDNSSTDFSKWASKQLSNVLGKYNLSPIEIDYFARNYLGMRYEPLANINFKDLKGNPVEEIGNTLDKIVTKKGKYRLFGDTAHNSQYSTDYYYLKDKVESEMKTIVSHTKVDDLDGETYDRYYDLKGIKEDMNYILNKEIAPLYEEINNAETEKEKTELSKEIVAIQKDFLAEWEEDIKRLKLK